MVEVFLGSMTSAPTPVESNLAGKLLPPSVLLETPNRDETYNVFAALGSTTRSHSLLLLEKPPGLHFFARLADRYKEPPETAYSFLGFDGEIAKADDRTATYSLYERAQLIPPSVLLKIAATS